jgi:hypothetical protein
VTFFNRKEEVIDLQLTQYGKYVLSKGRFKPMCYAFFDDDIIYDTAYSDEPKELAQDTFNRISTVPRLKTIHNVEGVEEKVKRLNEINSRKAIDSFNNRIPDYFKSSGLNTKTPLDDLYGIDYIDKLSMVVDSRKLLRNIIGTSELGTDFYPAWNVKTLTSAKINEPFTLLTSGEKFEYQTIPLKMSSSLDEPHVRKYQLEMTPRLVILNHNDTEDDESIDFQTGFDDVVEGLPDNRKMTFLEKPDIILDIKEHNVFSENESFEVEVFEIVDPTEKNKDFLRKLYFTSQIVDEKELEKIPIENRVETYFEINFDENIIMPINSNEGGFLDRALLEDKLDEFYNTRRGSRVTLFDRGVEVTAEKNSQSEFSRDAAGNDLDANKLLNRNDIGNSLYDFDRELDDEDCE